jgi:peroxiredoxin family protein
MEQKYPIKKVNLICAKGAIEDVYATLILGNGAVMEGIETNIFFTFFGLDAIIKGRMDKLHTAVVGNPALRLPGGLRMPTLLGIIPGMESFTSRMMKGEMAKLDVPPVSEIYACKMAMEMFKFKKEDLCEHVIDILTVGQFYEHAAGEGSQIIFT